MEDNTPDEVGTWVSLCDSCDLCPYYLIEDSIYVGYISLTNQTPIEFFSTYKSKQSWMVLPLTGVDIKSFEVNINDDHSPYARDKKSVFYPGANIYEGGPEFFDGEYGGGELYYGDISIEGADPKTFQYIGNKYAKDINNVYFKGYVVSSADILTFKVLGKGYAIDKTNMYHRGIRIEWNDHIISTLQQPDYQDTDYKIKQ